MPQKVQNTINEYIKEYARNTQLHLNNRMEMANVSKEQLDAILNDRAYWAEHNKDGNPLKQEENIFRAAMDPNNPSFQNIELLPEALQDFIGKYYYEKFKQECADELELGLNSKKVREYINEHSTDIGFRLGLSMARTADGQMGLEAEYLEHYANISVMKKTLEVPGEEQINNLKQQIRSELGADATPAKVNELCKEQLAMNQGVQMEMVTQLLLDQLGNSYIKLEDGRRIEYTGSTAEMYAHGGRTTLIFPGSKDSADLFSTIMLNDDEGKNMVSSPLSARGFATHSADLSISGSGETKVNESRMVSYFNNYGTNPAMGGIGNKLSESTVIKNDGRNSHMYLRAVSSDSPKKGSYMLRGIETTATGMTGFAGKKHGPSGSSSKVSGMFASKQKYGRENGGRMVILSHIDSDKLKATVRQFQSKVLELQNNIIKDPEDLTSKAEYNKLIEGLAGPKLTMNQLQEMVDPNIENLYTPNPNQPLPAVRINGVEMKGRVEPHITSLIGRDNMSDLIINNAKDIPRQPVAKDLLGKLKKTDAKLKNFWKSGKVIGSSTKMKNVRKALTALASTSDNPANTEAVIDLLNACTDYLTDPGKNRENLRYNYVKEAFKLALEKVDTLDFIHEYENDRQLQGAAASYEDKKNEFCLDKIKNADCKKMVSALLSRKEKEISGELGAVNGGMPAKDKNELISKMTMKLTGPITSGTVHLATEVSPGRELKGREL